MTATHSLSLDEFLQSVEKRAFRMAVIATKQPSDALDIVQEAMFKLVKHYRQRSAEEWGPLFHTILQRAIVQWHRDKNRRRRFFWQADPLDDEVDSIAESPAPYQQNPDMHWQINTDTNAIVAALEQLPLRQQQAFILRAWEGYDVNTTAQIMGCSDGSVKTHYSRAIHTLRAALTEAES